MSVGWVGSQPRSSLVSVLDAGLSMPMNIPSQPKCSAASSGETETAGTPSCLPITSATARIGTPSSPTACSTDPAGAFSSARRNRRAASNLCTAGHRLAPSSM